VLTTIARALRYQQHFDAWPCGISDAPLLCGRHCRSGFANEEVALVACWSRE
jgi:hypothetical protein